MEIFGGFMAMMSIATLFLAVVWLIMPFVVFAIKGKQEHTLELLAELKQQLNGIERRLAALEPQFQSQRRETASREPVNASAARNAGLPADDSAESKEN